MPKFAEKNPELQIDIEELSKKSPNNGDASGASNVGPCCLSDRLRAMVIIKYVWLELTEACNFI